MAKQLIGDRRRGERPTSRSGTEQRAGADIADQYGTLMRSIDVGFCILEMIVDGERETDDARFVEVNGAFERQLDLTGVKGRTMLELLPGLEGRWLERYRRIARTGQAERFEDEMAALGRWFDVLAWRLGQRADRLVAVSSRDITGLKAAAEALGDRERELASAKVLQTISTRLLSESTPDLLYAELVQAAIDLMQADAASMQLLESDSHSLRLLASTGFPPEVEDHWASVDVSDPTACGRALLRRERVIIEDVEADELIAGTADLQAYRRAGLRAVQTTPLVSRSGRVVGMLSTLWSQPYAAGERDYQVIDVLAGQAADLVERALTEAALRRSEERLQTMLGIEGVGVLTFRRQDGALIGANDAFLQMHGYSHEEIESGALTWRDLTPPEYVIESEQQMARLAATGRIGPYEKEFMRKDGSRVWMALAGADIGDGTVVEYCIDVSDRKRAEAALRENEERMRTYLSNSPVVFARTDADLRYESIFDPHAELELAEVVGKRDDELAQDPGADALLSLKRRVLRGGEQERAEITFSRTDGERTYDITATPLLSERGQVEGVVSAALDVTERKQVEDRLRETEQELREALATRDQLVGFISHELRTPITVILGMSQLLVKGTLPKEQQRELVADVYSSAQELDAMMEALLLIARLGTSDGRIDAEPVLLPRFVAGLLEAQRVSDADHEYRLEVRSDDAIAECHADWVERVLANLLGNAAKYSPPGSSITTIVEAVEGEVRVSVLDEGSGIVSDEIERLFEPFYRSPTVREAVPGAGLGLTVCRRIVESMGGRIWAHSRPAGGAAFEFVLPAAAELGSAEE